MSESELSALETVMRLGGVSGDLGEDDGDEGLRDGVLEGETMGSSGDCGSESGGDSLTDCMLSSSMTVRSLVTHRVFRGTTGVPKDCW